MLLSDPHCRVFNQHWQPDYPLPFTLCRFFTLVKSGGKTLFRVGVENVSFVAFYIHFALVYELLHCLSMV